MWLGVDTVAGAVHLYGDREREGDTKYTGCSGSLRYIDSDNSDGTTRVRFYYD